MPAEFKPVRRADESGIGRRIAIAILVTIGALAIALGNLYVWVVRTTLNTDAWVAATAPLARDPAIQKAIGTLVIERVDERIDIEGWVSERLPDALDPIAAAIAAAARQAVDQAVFGFLASDGFAQAWETAMRDGHEGVVTFVRETDVDPTVPLKIDSIVAGIDQRLSAFGIDLFGPEGPRSLGDVAIRLDDRFDQVQAILAWAERLVLIVPLIALACFALALGLARRRGRLFVTIAATTGVFIAIELIVFRLVAAQIAEVPTNPVYADGVEAILSILLAGLFAQTQALLLLSLVIAVGAFVARGVTNLEPVRSFIMDHGRWLQLAVVGLAIVYLVVAADLTTARALLVAALGAAAVIGIEAVMREEWA